MTDIALQNAMARLSEIASDRDRASAEILRLKNEIHALYEEEDNLRQFVDTWHRLADIPAPPMAERIEVKPTERKRARLKNPDREFVVEKALEIIRERGEPMPRRELFDALAERGITISGKDPEMVLSTMLWRTKARIQRLVPFGYWPAGEPYGPAEQLKAAVGNL